MYTLSGQSHGAGLNWSNTDKPSILHNLNLCYVYPPNAGSQALLKIIDQYMTLTMICVWLSLTNLISIDFLSVSLSSGITRDIWNLCLNTEVEYSVCTDK